MGCIEEVAGDQVDDVRARIPCANHDNERVPRDLAKKKPNAAVSDSFVKDFLC